MGWHLWCWVPFGHILDREGGDGNFAKRGSETELFAVVPAGASTGYSLLCSVYLGPRQSVETKAPRVVHVAAVSGATEEDQAAVTVVHKGVVLAPFWAVVVILDESVGTLAEAGAARARVDVTLAQIDPGVVWEKRPDIVDVSKSRVVVTPEH